MASALPSLGPGPGLCRDDDPGYLLRDYLGAEKPPPQALVALTVLALAAAMINQQVYGSPPVTVRYSTFTGGFGMLVCLVGAAAVFVAFIPALVPLVLDGVAGLLFLAGGIVRCFSDPFFPFFLSHSNTPSAARPPSPPLPSPLPLSPTRSSSQSDTWRPGNKLA